MMNIAMAMTLPPHEGEGRIFIDHESERTLALALDAFDGALRAAYDKKAPHFLAEHAFSTEFRDWNHGILCRRKRGARLHGEK